MYTQDKIINEMVDFLKKDKGVKKHRVGEITAVRMDETHLRAELFIQWNSRNFTTVKPVIKRIRETYGDVVNCVGFYNGYTPHIHIPLTNVI